MPAAEGFVSELERLSNVGRDHGQATVQGRHGASYPAGSQDTPQGKSEGYSRRFQSSQRGRLEAVGLDPPRQAPPQRWITAVPQQFMRSCQLDSKPGSILRRAAICRAGKALLVAVAHFHGQIEPIAQGTG